MATSNIDCSFPKLNSACFNTVEFMHANSALLRQEVPPYAELQRTIDSNPALRVQHNSETVNHKCTTNNNTELDTSKTGTSKLSCRCCSGQRYENGSSVNNARLLDNVLQQELSISVDTDEESGHGWRPSFGNSLSSDVFMAKPNSPDLPFPVGDSPDDVILQLPSFESGNRKDPSRSNEECSPYTINLSHSRHDVQSYLQSQRAELNVLKYEVMNARRTINDSNCAIRNLDKRLKEVLQFQNTCLQSKEIEKLSTENAQLRLECQCYCMEVDFYLRGCSISAPLGEVDEKFYVGNDTAQSKESETVDNPLACKTEDQDEAEDKWECHKCTFANHPAINCCEICQVPRLRAACIPRPRSFAEDECFCHPKERSQAS